MKDILGINIEVGSHVVYFRSLRGSFFPEQAKVTRINARTITIEYYDGKRKGKQSNIFKTEGKIFILGYSETAKQEHLKIIKDITKINNQLRMELEKIHSRFEILDI